MHSVPDVSGMPMRDGVRRLHESGFRVHVEGSGRIARTKPDARAEVEHGSVIRVVGGGRE